MFNTAPLDYERYAALSGLIAVPVNGSLDIKPPQRQTGAIDPANMEVGHRQTFSMRGQVERFNPAPIEKQETMRLPVFVVDQTLTDLSWLAEITSGAVNAGIGPDYPSIRKAISLYGAWSEAPPQAFRLLA